MVYQTAVIENRHSTKEQLAELKEAESLYRRCLAMTSAAKREVERLKRQMPIQRHAELRRRTNA